MRKIYGILGIVVLLAAVGSVSVLASDLDIITTIVDNVLKPLNLEVGIIHGGGSVPGRDPNFKATFGIDGDLNEGHLSFHDHNKAAKIDIETNDIIIVVETMDKSMGAMIGYYTDPNGDDKAFIVFVKDAGEPGKDDAFLIGLPEDSYVDGGTLQGGNIQIGHGNIG